MGNRKNKSRSQKRKFIGNRFTERTKPLDVPTVSEQKLKTTSVSFENIPSKDDKLSGNRILDVEILRTVFNCLCCPSCLSVNLQLTEDSMFWIIFRSNIGNLEEMQRAVIEAFYHCCSGKSNPMHGQCPLGSESWCTYQRAQSAGKVFYDKNAGLPKSIINKIKPTYLQLCEQNLLKKCLHGKTQNAIEAFNGCLWNVVPKEIFVELQTFSLGSYIAVMLLSVLEALDIKIGSYTLRGYAAIDQTRIKDSKRHTLPSAKVTRKKFELLKEKSC
ncbi:uncharacterized protein TNCV_2667751 [Trichonephila clavipes]|nr:uncharacterized protein TNCV_2667751 [Trichonephila clavipes]